MKIKRTQKTEKMQFIVVSHFDSTTAVSIKDMLSKIMVSKANEELNRVNKSEQTKLA